jgi:hypothetical protein
MQEQSNFKYIYKGEEVTQEEFNKLTKDSFKWFNNSSINAVDFNFVSKFFSGDYKSNSEVEKHFKGMLSDSNPLLSKNNPEEEAPLGSFGKRGVVIDYTTAGKKENKGKPQLSLLFTQFPKALEAVAKCSEYGHLKYEDTDVDYLNYQRVKGGSKSYADAGLRHRLYKKGTTDIESQLPHAYHVCWNALAELELLIKENYNSPNML